MNENRKYSKSFSKRKSSYAPIILTSKAVKPLQRQSNSNSQYFESPHYNKTKLVRFMKQCQSSVDENKQMPENNGQVERLNFTQNNFNRIKHQELGRTFSYVTKNDKKIKKDASQILNGSKKPLFDDFLAQQENKNEFTHDKNSQKQFDPFSIKQPATSGVVNVQFDQQHLNDKVKRKNNFNNNSRYQILLANTNLVRQSKSVPPKQISCQNNKESQELIVETNENKQRKQLRNSIKKNFSISTNKPIETYFWLKDPNRKFMLSQKHKNFDLTFSNFKQKIYEKKANRVSNQKSKYNEQWSEYLNKYYLNIKKVKPLFKCTEQPNMKQVGQNDDDQQRFNSKGNASMLNQTFKRQARSSAEIVLSQIRKSQRQVVKKTQIKINGMEQSQELDSQKEQNGKIRSNTIMATSKTASLISNKVKQPSSPQKQIKNPDLAKIQLDIFTKRISINRKDHFVFGMGDNANSSKNQNPNLFKFHLYKDFLWKVNFSNLIHVKMPDDIEKPYKFFVGRGNNAPLIKGIMRRRFWWQIVDKISPEVNFLWTQLRVNQFVKGQKKRKNQPLRIILDQNFLKSSEDHSDLQSLIQNFKQSYQLNGKIFKGKDLEIWLNHFRENQKHQQKHSQDINFNILQKRVKSMIRKKKLSFWDSSQTNQKKTHNHFESNFYIGNKKALFYAMRKYYKLYGQDPFDFIPLTFHISGGLEDPQFNQFLQKYSIINEERMKNKNSDVRNIWIVKPGEVTNRGRGITVCATLDEIKIRLKSKQKNSDGSLRTYILQKYIEKPLLYQKRKFDIRHYMLMTCINGCIKGYWYQEGYIRTTSTEYNIKNCKDLYTHLTNDAIQKNSADYGKYEKGNKISYDQFQKYLTKTYRRDFDFFQEILPKMKRLATDAMRATYSIIEPNRRENNFELFGLDFMLDQNMKVYLIQCNTNPCLQLSCPLLSKIISGLIENVFKICIDPIFPPPFEWPNSKKFQMGQNALDDMKFQIVFDQLSDGKELQKLYGAQKGFGQKIGKVQEDQQEYQDQQEDKQWTEESNQ